MLRILSFLIALSLTIAVVVGSLLSPTNISNAVAVVNDKIVHGVAYMTITFFWLLAKPLSFMPKKSKTILLGVFVMGISIEVLQGILTKNRQADVWDIVANTVGILMSYVIFVLFLKKNHIVCKNNL